MKAKEFLVLNAFAARPFGGNPAAVFLNAREIPEEELLPIARQLNLIETVFAYPNPRPGVDYRLRYFTPLQEYPVAGHPTVATWVALAQGGHIDVKQRATFVQENHAGQQQITVSTSEAGYLVSMVQPAPTYTSPVGDISRIAESIGLSAADLDPTLPVQGVSVGLGHIIVPVLTRAALARAQMDISKVQALCTLLGMREMQLFSFETSDPSCQLATRNFTPREGLEDPACGNGNGALGAYLAQTRYKDAAQFRLRAEQGHGMNMPSEIEISLERSARGVPIISIAGSAVPMVRGEILA